MKKQFKKLESNLQRAKKELADLETRKTAAVQDLERLQADFGSLEEPLQRALADGQTAEIEDLEAKRFEFQQQAGRVELLIPGLMVKINETRARIETLESERNGVFAKLSEKWLSQEIKEFDQAAEAYRDRLRRLGAVGTLLREINAAETFRKTLGEACNYFSGIQILNINGFDRLRFLNTKSVLHSGKELLAAISKEITEGK